MTFEELTQRLHAVMDSYGISHRRDLAFLSSIAWVFGITVDFKLVDRQEVEDVSDDPAPIPVR